MSWYLVVFILSSGKDKQPSGNINCSFDFSTILGFIILLMVIWDCLIFIVKKTGELLWLRK